MKALLIILTILMFSKVHALRLKIGVLAPEGTNWAVNLQKMAKEVAKTTEERVTLKFYFGGVQGDESDVLRKIRIGQLHGGIFTGKTLGEIHGDIRVLELPFTFYKDREKALRTMDKLSSHFDKKLDESGFINLGLVEIGQVYFVSKRKVQNLQALNGLKIWSWQGDKLVNTILKEMKLISTPLALPDVLSSLSTGIIDAAYAPPLGIVALQWHTKIRYLINFPLAYSIGAFLIDKKRWLKINSQDRMTITNIGKKYEKIINASNAKDNQEALSAMKSLEIQFLDFPKSDIVEGRKVRDQVVEKLKGSYFSQEIYDKLVKEL